MCICVFNVLELTTLNFGVGVVCEGMFEQQLYSQQSRHPQVGNGWHAPKNLDAWLCARYGKRIPPCSVRGGDRMPLVDLLVCASVWDTDLSLLTKRRYLFLFLLGAFVVIHAVVVVVCVDRTPPLWESMKQACWQELSDSLFWSGDPRQAGRRRLSLLVGWAASAWSTGSSLEAACDDVWVMVRVKEVFCVRVVYAMNTQTQVKHRHIFNLVLMCLLLAKQL